MFKKKIYNYKLNTLGIEYFKRVTLRSGEIVFIKTTMDKPFEMILDDFNEFGKKTKIYNGNQNLTVCNDAIASSIKIISSEENVNHYDALTEDIIINTFFCKRISKRLNIEVIPSYLVEEERYSYEKIVGLEKEKSR
mgnify:CR=1 FL=1